MRIIKVHNCKDCPFHDIQDTNEHTCFQYDSFVGVITNYPEPLKSCPIAYKEPDNDMLINNIELASELAELRVEEELLPNPDNLYRCKEDLWNGENYKPQVQEVYNEWYDYYRTIIDNLNQLK